MKSEVTMRNTVFISYSHHDSRWLNRLRVHLRPLERDYKIEVWDDTRMSSGSDWRKAIADAISSAKVGILLISADFLASDFIVNHEMPPLLEAATSDGATILCVIINPCRFERTHELSQFQAVNNPDKPLAKLPIAEREAIWVKVADAVEACFEGRRAAEGWLVRNERLLFDALRQLVREGSESGFLIASVGDYYLQFAPQGDVKILYTEAVSDAFLPEHLQLSKKSADLLVKMGFEEPTDNSSNYHRTYKIGEDGRELNEIASTAIKVLASVYRVSERSDVEIKLVL
jgi:hypothetical protein